MTSIMGFIFGIMSAVGFFLVIYYCALWFLLPYFIIGTLLICLWVWWIWRIKHKDV